MLIVQRKLQANAGPDEVADKVVFLYQGKVIYFGAVSELARCEHPHIKEFLAMDQVRI